MKLLLLSLWGPSTGNPYIASLLLLNLNLNLNI